MVQVVDFDKTGGFGRAARGFTKGLGDSLAENIPKEIERKRLASGLQKFAEGANERSPLQNLAQLAGIPGAAQNPQLLQTAGELAKHQGMRSAYKDNRLPENKALQGQIQQGLQPRDVNFANLDQAQPSRIGQKETIPSGFSSREQEANATQYPASQNPTQEKFKPAIPWTQQQWEDDFNREADRNPNATYEQIKQKVNENQQRFLAAPEAERARLDYERSQEDLIDNQFDKDLQTILQKEGKDIFEDLSGDTLLKMKKVAYNDLSTNPNSTPKKAVDKAVRMGRDFARVKNQVRKNANPSWSDVILPSRKSDRLDNLKSAQKVYSEMGAEQEFNDMLRTKNEPPSYRTNPKTGVRELENKGNFGYDLSPGGASLISYPRSEPLKKIIKDSDFNIFFDKIPAYSRQLAKEFAEKRTAKDSPQAFARELKDKTKLFDERAFFDYLRENQKNYNFSPEQVEAIVTGVSDITPNWGDIALFPIFGRSKAHD